jgi:hypothetical protein
MKARRYRVKAQDIANLHAGTEACAICRRADKLLVVDHCHNTGALREMLCERCNSMLGFVREDPDVLRRAIEYIERHKA